jgi:hypothetical protein
VEVDLDRRWKVLCRHVISQEFVCDRCLEPSRMCNACHMRETVAFASHFLSCSTFPTGPPNLGAEITTYPLRDKRPFLHVVLPTNIPKKFAQKKYPTAYLSSSDSILLAHAFNSDLRPARLDTKWALGTGYSTHMQLRKNDALPHVSASAPGGTIFRAPITIIDPAYLPQFTAGSMRSNKPD